VVPRTDPGGHPAGASGASGFQSRTGFEFFVVNGQAGFLVLYALFLVATGGEALYADLRHFVRKPIRQVWFAFMLPALTNNYFGPGALMMADPTISSHHFFYLAPSWGLVPLILQATAATCIASQAVTTGA